MVHGSGEGSGGFAVLFIAWRLASGRTAFGRAAGEHVDERAVWVFIELRIPVRFIA
jgi:hypothetical protein